MWKHFSFTTIFLGVIFQVAISQSQQGGERQNLPSGLEIVDPKELGLSDSDFQKYFGNVKQLQTLSLPGYGPKTQILTVGFDDNEKINLQNFDQLSTSGLEGADKNVAQNAFKQFQSIYGSSGNGSVDLDGLTTLFSQNPKLDVLESLNLIPPNTSHRDSQHQQSSPKQQVKTFHDEEKSVNQQIKEQVEQEQKNIRQHQQSQDFQSNGQVYFQPQQQFPYPFFHPNYIPQQQQYLPQQYFTQIPPYVPIPPEPTPPQQFIQVAPTGQPQVHHQQQQMPPVHLPTPLAPRGPPPTAPTPFGVQVRPMSQPPFMQIPTAQPQYVRIRQKGEPQQEQQQQFVQLSSPPTPAPPGQFIQQIQPHHQQQYVIPQSAFLQQIQVQQPNPTASPYELNYANPSHPMMIVHNPPVLGHSAFLEMYKDNSQEQGRLKDPNLPFSVDLTTDSLKETPDSNLNSLVFFSGNNNNLNENEQFSNFQQTPQTFSTIYKQNPILVSRPLLTSRPTPQPTSGPQFGIGPQKPIGSHYQGRHIANVRRPSAFQRMQQGFQQGLKLALDGPAFGTQPPYVQPPPSSHKYNLPQSEPNMYMMPPVPGLRSNYRVTKSAPRPPIALHNISLQPQQQQLSFQSIAPSRNAFIRGGLKEPKPSMPLIKISKPENAMKRVVNTNKFLEEIIHAFGNKLS